MYKDNPAIDILRDAKHVKAHTKHHKVLLTMWDVEEGYYVTFKHIDTNTNIGIKSVRRIVRHLKRKGLVEHCCGLFDEDGMVCGSGHGLTRRGRTILAIIAEGDK